MNHFKTIIFLSDEDQIFVADVPELPGCKAHGDSHEDGLAMVAQRRKLAAPPKA